MSNDIPRSVKSLRSTSFQRATNSSGLILFRSASTKMGVPKSSVAPTCITSSPLSLQNLTNMSAGKYVEVMCPRWISPFAYIRAVVTMIFSSSVHLQFYKMFQVPLLKHNGILLLSKITTPTIYLPFIFIINF